MKKVFALLLCLLMFASASTANSFAAESKGSLDNFVKVNSYSIGQFSDVKDGEWYSENVKIAFEYGLMLGDGVTTFNPNGTITIAEAVVLACRIHSIYYGDDEKFVQGVPWYQVYVDYAINNSIIQGEYLDYTKNATCSELTVILFGALPIQELYVINDILDGDIPDIPYSANYSAAVYTFYRAGILTGNNRFGTFSPESPICRAAAAAIATRLADTTLRKSFKIEKYTLIASETEVALNKGEVILVTFTHNVLSTELYYHIADTSVATAEWGKWSGKSIPLAITAVAAGSTTVIVSYTSYDGNTISTTIPITVNGAITITLPDIPQTLSCDAYDGSKLFSCEITDISYKVNEWVHLDEMTAEIYFTGTNTYSKYDDISYTFGIKWKLYDSDGYVINSGTCYTAKISNGESFKNSKTYISGLRPGAYTLKLIGVTLG